MKRSRGGVLDAQGLLAAPRERGCSSPLSGGPGEVVHAPLCLCLQQYLCVADLARKDKRVLRKKYQIYFW